VPTIKTIEEWSAELDLVTRNIEEATKMFFTEQGMQRAAKRDRMVLEALNHNPRFWTVASHSMTVGVYMAMRRIMDEGADASSMQRVIQFVVQSPEEFDEVFRTALKRRELSDGEAHVRREQRRLLLAMKRLGRAFRSIDREWKRNYQAITTFVFAHSIPSKVKPGAFNQTNIRWIDRALCKLAAITDELRNLERNGQVPSQARRPLPYFRAESLKAARVEMLRLKVSYLTLLPEMRSGRRRGFRTS
jgi:hypothetical protein